MYQNLVRSVDDNAPESVHHCTFPTAAGEALDQRLLAKMRLGITVAGLGRAARGAADLKLRQPLAAARVNVGTEQARQDLMDLADVLSEEINVKSFLVVSEVGELVDYRVLPNNRVLGPKYGRQFKAVRKALEGLAANETVAALQEEGEIALQVDGDTITLTADELLIQTESRGGLAVASDKGVTVAVDTELTEALLQEGFARDLVRTINNMRKEAGLEISDRIDLSFQAQGNAAAALANFGDYVRQETLAVTLSAGELGDGAYREETVIGDEPVVLTLRRAAG
jgi:isoleucyl-tRNA synthetase